MKNLIATLAGFCAFGLLSTTPALGQAATDVNCDGCVHSGDIATNGVRRADIQNFSINTPKLNNFAVTTEKIKPGAVTESKIADGAVSPDKMNATDLLFNTRYGLETLFSNTTGVDNIAIGPYALWSNTEGYSNTAIGASPLWQNTTGFTNTAIGWCAMCSNTTGGINTAIGHTALYSNTSGMRNTAIGLEAMYDNTTGVDNTAIGFEALDNNTGGHSNTALGAGAGLLLTTGHYNIVIGADVNGVAGENRTTRIGSSSFQTRAFIGGVRGVTTGNANAVSVVIDSNGQLGTISSSNRYKEDIQHMGVASDRLLQLRPVTFRYKEAYANGEKPLDYGLIAEEVAEVFPELVVFNEDNQPETVKYRLLSSLLLNELQKQHSELNKLSGQVAEIADQSAEISELKAQVAELNQLVQQMAKLALPATELVAINTGD